MEEEIGGGRERLLFGVEGERRRQSDICQIDGVDWWRMENNEDGRCKEVISVGGEHWWRQEGIDA